MRTSIIPLILMSSMLIFSCKTSHKEAKTKTDNFKFFVEQFADLKILRYQVPGFDTLSLNQKKLIYFLSQAAVAGRDIIFDQNGKYNLAIRRTLENIVENYKGDRNTDDFKKFMIYTKRVWFSNGIYHHYASDKFMPEFSQEYFKQLIAQSDPTKLPLAKGETTDKFLTKIIPVMFDPAILPKKVNQDPTKDMVMSSAGNFYEGVNQKEAEEFYKNMRKPDDKEPLSYGLNSRLVKENGKIYEKVYKVGGLYGSALAEIVK